MPPATTSRPPLSVLDLAIVNAGASSGDALRSTTAVAQRADALGYRRFWVAEHHNMASVASTTPPVLMAHLAASTEQIMSAPAASCFPTTRRWWWPSTSPPWRRCTPGASTSASAERRAPIPAPPPPCVGSPDGLSVEDFPRDLLAVMGLLGDPRTEGDDGLWERFRATPAATTAPEIWLLGSSGYSAQLAGILGLRFAFAHHFDTGGTLEAAELYRQAFRPSPVLDEPHLMVTANVIAAATTDEANYEAGPGRLMVRGIRSGRFEALVTPAEAAARSDLDPVPSRRSGRLVGTLAEIVAGLDDLAARTGATELMVSTVAHDPAVRQRSLELLMEAWTA